MMSQEEAHESTHQRGDQVYGRYEGGQSYDHQQFETPYQHPLGEGPAARLYTPVSDNKNMLRLVAFGMAMVALIVFAVICLIFVGGTGGWISFCAACLTTFIVAVVAIDKIK